MYGCNLQICGTVRFLRNASNIFHTLKELPPEPKPPGAITTVGRGWIPAAARIARRGPGRPFASTDRTFTGGHRFPGRIRGRALALLTNDQTRRPSGVQTRDPVRRTESHRVPCNQPHVPIVCKP
ncbi:hypothetical protein J6590_004264 [Homalodisca vitripennis]|nr:hypothetical protein J6590_004264 [Homalodisca vitripennis]